MVASTACMKAGTSNCPPVVTNFIRFSDARLHAVSSRNMRSEEHTSELQSHHDLVCRLLLEKKKRKECTGSGCGALDSIWSKRAPRHPRRTSTSLSGVTNAAVQYR